VRSTFGRVYSTLSCIADPKLLASCRIALFASPKQAQSRSKMAATLVRPEAFVFLALRLMQQCVLLHR
jgi:hypothetical protein